jgi:hypothetical protein
MLWMTQEQMALLFGIDRSGITKHLQNIFSEGELEELAVCAKNARTAADGKTYEVQHYNLDAVISFGYRKLEVDQEIAQLRQSAEALPKDRPPKKDQ